MRVALAFGGGFAIYGIERTASIYDTRFLAPNPDEADQARYLYLLLEGDFAWIGGERFVGPAAFFASAAAFDGDRGTRATPFRAGGETFRAVQLRVVGDALGDRGWDACVAVPFTAATQDACNAYLAARDDATRGVAGESLIRSLAADGVLREQLPAHSNLVDVAYEGLWKTLFPVFERFAFGTTRGEFRGPAATSTRDPRFDMNKLAASFHFAFGGWREFARRCRMRLAVLALSNPEIPVRDIAKAIGYSTTEAFTHAFYADGFGPPGAVRDRILQYAAEEARESTAKTPVTE